VVCLVTYAGESEDFTRTPLAELIEQISAGTLKVQAGKIFRLDERMEAHRVEAHRSVGTEQSGARSLY
jgi:hypothetical protein